LNYSFNCESELSFIREEGIYATIKMYTFNIKDTSPDIKVLITRSLLAFSAVISLLYQNNQYYYINIIASAILFITAIGINRLFVKFRLNVSLLLCIAAVILFIATRSIPFAVMLLVLGLLTKSLNKSPIVHINTEGVSIKRMFGSRLHSWGEFNNIILKDNLLTLDFRNNKLLQLNIVESNISVDENSFNTFCSGFIGV
jgi:hypothetical protein